jgi:prophage regulatory protein
MPDTNKKPERILRKRAVSERTGLPHSSIYRFVDEGRFPPPIRLGPRTIGWLESEVDAWIADRIAETRGKAA